MVVALNGRAAGEVLFLAAVILKPRFKDKLSDVQWNSVVIAATLPG